MIKTRIGFFGAIKVCVTAIAAQNRRNLLLNGGGMPVNFAERGRSGRSLILPPRCDASGRRLRSWKAPLTRSRVIQGTNSILKNRRLGGRLVRLWSKVSLVRPALRGKFVPG